MKNPIIALFGEAEKGSFKTFTHIKNLGQLCDTFGNPPEESFGIPLAIQTLLYQKELLFLRVQEEGFSLHEYIEGIKLLEKTTLTQNLSAICMPGVGNDDLINMTFKLCEKRGSLFITSPRDLYDYLTHKPGLYEEK